MPETNDTPKLVIGASGQTGRRVVKILLAKGFKVRAFVRNQDKAQFLRGYLNGAGVSDDRLELALGDPLAPAELLGATAGVDKVLTNLGGTPGISVEDREAIEHYF